MHEISLMDDILDSRDIEKRIEELESDEATAALADLIVSNGEITDEDETNGDYDDACELAIWRNLRKECEGYGWEYGIGFIREDYFETYAQDLAEDIGVIDRNANWPLTHIDWESAARDLLVDYTSVEVDGATYYFREA